MSLAPLALLLLQAVLPQVSTVEARFAPPQGFRRIAVPHGSFGAWLRRLPLRPAGSPVRLFDGRLKANQAAHVAVIDLDVGRRDLQQCADAVIRLRAEHLFDSGCAGGISFRFTSGDEAAWSAWRDGMRPVVVGNRVSWRRSAAPDASRASFRRYLDCVFTYAGSASLSRELVAVEDPARPEPGDVFIQGGFPGHAVIVLDVAEDASGRRAFLLAQSYMPAQEIHVLTASGDTAPWTPARSSGPLPTPEWEFEHGDLRRFAPASCEPRAAR